MHLDSDALQDEAERPTETLKSEMCPIGGKGKKKSATSQPFPILQNASVKAINIQGNPVGELQELCTSKKWPAPNYEQLEEWGPSHGRSFKLRVSINDGTGTISEEGCGTPKKMAKKIVAMQMIKRLKE